MRIHEVEITTKKEKSAKKCRNVCVVLFKTKPRQWNVIKFFRNRIIKCQDTRRQADMPACLGDTNIRNLSWDVRIDPCVQETQEAYFWENIFVEFYKRVRMIT